MFEPKIMDFFSIPFTDKGVTKFFTTVFKETLECREANYITRPDFMKLIMQLMRRGYVDGDDGDETPSIADVTNGKITQMEGAAQACAFFLAGFESTSSTITYCLYELARNQHVQDKVMEDIDKALKQFGALTHDSLQEMTYLHKVINKTLRKYRSMYVLNRVCTKDIDLPTTSLHMSKDLDVVIPVYGIHMNPNIYPEPDKFNNELFNAENVDSRHPYGYLPFCEGPRLCIGMRFAYSQKKVGLISMLLKYLVRLGPNTLVPLQLDPGTFMLAYKGGVELLVELR